MGGPSGTTLATVASVGVIMDKAETIADAAGYKLDATITMINNLITAFSSMPVIPASSSHSYDFIQAKAALDDIDALIASLKIPTMAPVTVTPPTVRLGALIAGTPPAPVATTALNMGGINPQFPPDPGAFTGGTPPPFGGVNTITMPHKPTLNTVTMPPLPNLQSVTFPTTVPTVTIPPLRGTFYVAKDINTTTKPTLAKPKMGELMKFVAPPVPDVNIDAFNMSADIPDDDFLTRFKEWVYSEPDYPRDAVEIALFNRILDDLLNGGYGIHVDDFQVIHDRAIDNAARARTEAMDTARVQLSAFGWKLPPGVVLKVSDAAMVKGQETLAQAQGDIVSKQLDMYAHAYEITGQRAQELTALVRQSWAAKMDRIIKIEEVKQQLLVASINAYVSFYNMKTEIFKAQVGLWTAKVQMKELEVRIYSTKVQAEATKLEGNKLVVGVYQAEYEGVKAEADIYKSQAEIDVARIQSETAKLGQNEVLAKIQATETDGQKVRIEAEQVRINALKGILEGEKAKVELYGAQVQGATAAIGAERNKTEMYRAEIEGANAAINAETAKIQQYKAQVDAYTAYAQSYAVQLEAYKARCAAESEKMRGYAALNEAYAGIAKTQDAEYSMHIKYYEAQLAAFNLEIEKYKATMTADELNIRKVQAENSALADMFRMDTALLEVESKAIATAAALGDSEQMLADKLVQTQADIDLRRSDTEVRAYAARIQSQVTAAIGVLEAYKIIAAAAINVTHASASMSDGTSRSAQTQYSRGWYMSSDGTTTLPGGSQAETDAAAITAASL